MNRGLCAPDLLHHGFVRTFTQRRLLGTSDHATARDLDASSGLVCSDPTARRLRLRCGLDPALSPEDVVVYLAPLPSGDGK
jgi:hypothetical protein